MSVIERFGEALRGLGGGQTLECVMRLTGRQNVAMVVRKAGWLNSETHFRGSLSVFDVAVDSDSVPLYTYHIEAATANQLLMAIDLAFSLGGYVKTLRVGERKHYALSDDGNDPRVCQQKSTEKGGRDAQEGSGKAGERSPEGKGVRPHCSLQARPRAGELRRVHHDRPQRSDDAAVQRHKGLLSGTYLLSFRLFDETRYEIKCRSPEDVWNRIEERDGRFILSEVQLVGRIQRIVCYNVFDDIFAGAATTAKRRRGEGNAPEVAPQNYPRPMRRTRFNERTGNAGEDAARRVRNEAAKTEAERAAARARAAAAEAQRLAAEAQAAQQRAAEANRLEKEAAQRRAAEANRLEKEAAQQRAAEANRLAREAAQQRAAQQRAARMPMNKEMPQAANTQYTANPVKTKQREEIEGSSKKSQGIRSFRKEESRRWEVAPSSGALRGG